MFLEPQEGAEPEIVVDASVGEELRRELTIADPEIRCCDLDRRKETGERGRGSHHAGDACQSPRDMNKGATAVVASLLDEQAVSIERRKGSGADIRRQHMQHRLLRQFVKTSVPVQTFSVVVFEERIGRKSVAIDKTQFGQQSKRHLQRQATNDVISEIESDKLHNLRCRGGEIGIVAVVAFPIQHQVRSQNAAARYRCNVGDILKCTRISQKTDHAQVIQGGAKSTAR